MCPLLTQVTAGGIYKYFQSSSCGDLPSFQIFTSYSRAAMLLASLHQFHTSALSTPPFTSLTPSYWYYNALCPCKGQTEANRGSWTIALESHVCTLTHFVMSKQERNKLHDKTSAICQHSNNLISLFHFYSHALCYCRSSIWVIHYRISEPMFPRPSLSKQKPYHWLLFNFTE